MDNTEPQPTREILQAIHLSIQRSTGACPNVRPGNVAGDDRRGGGKPALCDILDCVLEFGGGSSILPTNVPVLVVAGILLHFALDWCKLGVESVGQTILDNPGIVGAFVGGIRGWESLIEWKVVGVVGVGVEVVDIVGIWVEWWQVVQVALVWVDNLFVRIDCSHGKPSLLLGVSTMPEVINVEVLADDGRGVRREYMAGSG